MRLFRITLDTGAGTAPSVAGCERHGQSPQRPGRFVLRASAVQVQDASDVVGRLQIDARGAGPRRNLDLCDHRADEIHRLGPGLRIRRQLLELRHAAAIKFREVRVADDCRGAPEAFQVRPEACRAQAVIDLLTSLVTGPTA